MDTGTLVILFHRKLFSLHQSQIESRGDSIFREFQHFLKDYSLISRPVQQHPEILNKVELHLLYKKY